VLWREGEEADNLEKLRGSWNMLSIEYEDWNIVCSEMLKQKDGRKKAYLQWFPFSRISSQYKKKLLDKDFFCKLIKTGLFLYFEETWLIADNYITKSDGNFRKASLVSPIMYLVMTSIGKLISSKYESQRSNYTHVFYAGNYGVNRFYYKNDYDIFFKMVYHSSKSYKYYIKTDIKDFFRNININKLFDKIRYRLAETGNVISEKDVLIYKELLLYLGQGEFPLVENSTCSSYLATVIYLESADIEIDKYINEKEGGISDFIMIRYVDDMYILFNTNIHEKKLTPLITRILNVYTNALKPLDLSLNRTKTTYSKTKNIHKDLKQSIYGSFTGKKINISNIFDARELIMKFLDRIDNELRKFQLDTIKYNKLINDVFSLTDTKYTPNEILNSLLYDKRPVFFDGSIIEKLGSLISFDYEFIKLDPKRLTLFLLNTRDENLIKTMLSKLFNANRKDIWDIYDTTIAITYLIQREFRHNDLLKVLKTRESNVYKYYQYFCENSFFKSIETFFHEPDALVCFSKTDNKLFFFYLLFCIELKKKNHLSAFAFYKNFFDRISAHIGHFITNGNNRTKKKPNYNGYYEKKKLQRLYSNIDKSEGIIEKAHKIRNTSPISHSSAELIDNNTMDEILKSIYDLDYLVKKKLHEVNILMMGSPCAN
jgi:AbiA family abortive infection protein